MQIYTYTFTIYIYIYIYIYLHILLTAAPEHSRPLHSSMAVHLLLEPPPWCLGVFFGSPRIDCKSEAPNTCLEVRNVAQKALRTSAESDFELSGGALGRVFRGTLVILNPFMPAYVCSISCRA